MIQLELMVKVKLDRVHSTLAPDAAVAAKHWEHKHSDIPHVLSSVDLFGSHSDAERVRTLRCSICVPEVIVSLLPFKP
jgi:hypothetical protein